MTMPVPRGKKSRPTVEGRREGGREGGRKRRVSGGVRMRGRGSQCRCHVAKNPDRLGREGGREGVEVSRSSYILSKPCLGHCFTSSLPPSLRIYQYARGRSSCPRTGCQSPQSEVSPRNASLPSLPPSLPSLPPALPPYRYARARSSCPRTGCQSPQSEVSPTDASQ